MTKRKERVARLCAMPGCDEIIGIERRPDARYCSDLCAQRGWRASRHTLCSFPGCPAKVHYVGLCIGHYSQRKRGAPLTVLQHRRRVQDGIKQCSFCERQLPVSDFSRRSSRESGVVSFCKDCQRDYKRGNTYGISVVAVRGLQQVSHCQNPGCRRELTSKTHVIDHDHDTGQIRGVLCRQCNAGLGLLGESVETVRGLLSYLTAS